MMSVGAVTTEDGKVCYKTAEGSVININISQPSYWDYLNDGVNGLRKIWSDAPPTFNEKIAALPLTLGVSQFPMGIISVAFYAIVLVTDLEIFRGAPLWMGIPFILSGPFEVVAYIKKQGFWVVLSVISQSLIFSVSVVGLVFTWDAGHYRGLSNGLLIMLLIIGSWGVISSTITIIYRLQTECEFCNTEKGPAEEDMEPLEKTPLYTITV
ncbi:uncharacterized protein [Aquarana catesbeiana]|uniref:uncharacterized protein isoform X4 n=1 Tax=Aquarana catesbeiana TaxID=8400 RepID=UPI003CC9557A